MAPPLTITSVGGRRGSVSSPDKAAAIIRRAARVPTTSSSSPSGSQTSRLKPTGTTTKHRRSDSTSSSASTLSASTTSTASSSSDVVSLAPSSVRTIVRIRPPAEPASSPLLLRCRPTLGKSIVQVTTCLRPVETKLYTADHVLDDASSQEDVFEAVGAAAVASLLDGVNGSIFTYGQTGSGKTYTMHGEPTVGAWHRGLLVRILEAIFLQLHGAMADCEISFVEILNEKTFDLLDGGAADAKTIREDTLQNQVFVQNVVQVPVESAATAVEWLQRGLKARKTAVTALCRTSSRGHAVFSIKVRQYGGRGMLQSVLHCVDLAGSEKQDPMVKCAAREAGAINKSLACLVGVLVALEEAARTANKRHIPYRDSKLTFLLRDALGAANSKSTLIATVSGESLYMQETLATLQFVERATHVAMRAKPNEDEIETMIHSLQSQVSQLKQRLAETKMINYVDRPLVSERPVMITEWTETDASSTTPTDEDKVDWTTPAVSLAMLVAGVCIGRFLRRR
ncbi:Aste57867_9335 [Aphanomyces stellatus]|uniref:Aste57867_9335 protein n=1 Tax=Aphanomyces stellatus TaxID=120398 RepID=A0A485KMS1_9STRA|nr:hypothetical protein As57867_009299 [Aphanomyces stellatus]VFT86217.1 Aste57867_9335 [Aphanomyces stellatus]